MKQQFFAFISYSRKDIRIARDIQQRLEKYPYPTNKVTPENRPFDNKYIRRVFLDVTDLSARERRFTDELKYRIENSKYLIIICSDNSKKSNYVQQEIEYFCKTHNSNSDNILPVLIDDTVTDFHPIIDSIIANRNCPIYFTKKEKSEHGLENKYCFYHIVEFLLKVDFNTLFNRYVVYTKSRARKRIFFMSAIFALIITFFSYGLYKNHRLAQFEKKTFPYSLVVGYVNNFMSPLLDCMDTTTSSPNFVLLMPKNYENLDNNERGKMYFEYIKKHYDIDSISKESYRSPIRKRDLDIMRLNIHNCHKPVYVDLVNTVSAFKYVIDYKINSDLYVEQSKNEMVEEYTNEYIQCTLDSLASKRGSLLFVKDTIELKQVLDSLITTK